ncbi:hypothetical protein [Actinomadura sp. 9N407]|uniref:hypothetical protein n=1 Tax=Actinomadura sp. 9N407 TaxID=3375154 RepID=UPI00379BB755
MEIAFSEERYMRAGALRISVGPGALAWSLFSVAFVLTLPLWLVALVAFVAIFDGGGLVAAVLFVLLVAICGSVLVFGMLQYERAYRLEGTVLVQRRTGRARRCDLSTAWVRMDALSPDYAGRTAALPQLIAWHDGHAPIRLWLRDPYRRRAMLPPHELLALANSIAYGREGDPRIAPIVDWLREMARQPL